MRAWRTGVPVVFAVAGLLFTTSHVAAGGGDLRNDRGRLTDLIASEQRTAEQIEEQVAQLRAEMERYGEEAAGRDGRVAAVRERLDGLAEPAGFLPVTGPGLTVELNDAPLEPGRPLPEGANVDDLVVHESDVQAVVNALWAGGAEAMMIMEDRVISTTAVRCVGNTLLLHGRVYAPPFRIAAIGDPEQLRAALDREPGVQLFQMYVEAYGLGFTVTPQEELAMPAYERPVELPHVRVPDDPDSTDEADGA